MGQFGTVWKQVELIGVQVGQIGTCRRGWKQDGTDWKQMGLICDTGWEQVGQVK